jgi:hypothetical protein
MKRGAKVTGAMTSPDLFGRWFSAPTWAAWRVFAKAVHGEPLAPAELETFRKHAGRTVYAPPPGGFPQAVAITGRQSGKTKVAALLADFEAIRAEPEAGADLYALLISQDQRAALRVLLTYARAPFESVPVLQRSVASRTADTIRLDTGVTLAAYPCRPAAVRGLRACIAVCDELAFFRSSENLPLDQEMLRAVRPCLATTGGKLIILSSPYAQSGALWELHRAHYGRDDSSTLVWCASAPEMNPTLPADYLQRMAEEDREAYRSEVLGEFRAGVSAFLDPEAIDAAVARGVRERPPVPGLVYQGFADPSGGRRDPFAVAVAHHAAGVAVLDGVRAWRPPFNPSGVVAEAAEFLKQYRVSTVRGDRYSGEFAAEQFRANGITYTPSELDRSALYLEFLPLLNSRKVLLLDLPELLRELRGLERRRGSSGRDRVDHGPRGHDDHANAAAGALHLAGRPRVEIDLRGAYAPDEWDAAERQAELDAHLRELEWDATEVHGAPWD